MLFDLFVNLLHGSETNVDSSKDNKTEFSKVINLSETPMHTPPDKLNLASVILMAAVLFGCNSLEPADIAGLWTLKAINVDGWERHVSPVFVDFKEGNSFAVSKVGGDFVGLYGLRASRIRFSSVEGNWFNASWKVTYFKDYMVWEGIDDGYRVTTLRFERISALPDFGEFEEKVLGQWDLYKIRKKDTVIRVSYTKLTFTRDGYYSIEDKSGMLEEGRAVINTRHRKVVFEKDNVLWDAWFYGDELRLNNGERDMQYSLRKPH